MSNFEFPNFEFRISNFEIRISNNSVRNEPAYPQQQQQQRLIMIGPVNSLLDDSTRRDDRLVKWGGDICKALVTARRVCSACRCQCLRVCSAWSARSIHIRAARRRRKTPGVSVSRRGRVRLTIDFTCWCLFTCKNQRVDFCLSANLQHNMKTYNLKHTCDMLWYDIMWSLDK